ncbi:MAG: Flp pilus assembly complex ATPase component TadA [Phycisphaeraceae bacterium]|nr:Flp pilus assembly complex ATPase component TadA [Phycisphaeraceae bacterium]
MAKRSADDLLNELAPEPTRHAQTSRADDAAMTDLYTPESDPNLNESRGLGDLLIARGVVKRERLTSAEQVIRQSPGRRLADVLIEQGADEAEVQHAIAELAGVPFERIDLNRGLDGGFDGRLLQRLGGEFCKQHLVVPLRTDGTRVVIGATRPDDVFLLDEIRSRLGVHAVKLVIVTAFEVRAALEIIGQSDQPEPDLSAILEDVDEADVEVDAAKQANEVDLEQQAGESPVIRYVNYIIQTAVKEGASDIHVEPSEKKLKVRFRIDGVLFEMMNPPVSMAAAITSRLKIMANLDISERRLPQDGRIRCTVQGRKLDLRMSTIPTPAGEKTVMRLLDTRSINVQLEDLGFAQNTLELWKRQVNAPHGIVLVTGPTGSGKTTTLYSSLRQLDKNKLNISTVEDPIEYHLDGITQTQTHDRIGMSFARALRALLRQDPDVIMVGEIRDQETAHVAVQAALTGHLVLSTLHTNDAPSSITRLVNIGIEPFLVGAAVNAVLAQRLVRRLCTLCKTQEPPDGEMAEYLTMIGMNADAIWTAPGCDRCRNTGYSGRVGVYELLVVDDQLRDVIARNPNVSEFRRMCLERGMVSLRDDGMTKVAAGLTTVAEVLRVTESAV